MLELEGELTRSRCSRQSSPSVRSQECNAVKPQGRLATGKRDRAEPEQDECLRSSWEKCFEFRVSSFEFRVCAAERDKSHSSKLGTRNAKLSLRVRVQHVLRVLYRLGPGGVYTPQMHKDQSSHQRHR